MSLSYIPPKCGKTREPRDKCCVSWCTHISYNIHDPVPLDNLKNHTALPYITSVTYILFILGALQYTMLIFRFPSLYSLRQYLGQIT